MTITMIGGLVVEALAIVSWVLLLGFAVWLYRRLHLPGVRWAAIYYLISIPSGMAVPFLMHAALPRAAEAPFRDAMLMVSTTGLVLYSVGHLVAIALLLADVTFLATQAVPALDLRPFAALMRVHERAGMFGVTLVATAVIVPLLDVGLLLVPGRA